MYKADTTWSYKGQPPLIFINTCVYLSYKIYCLYVNQGQI